MLNEMKTRRYRQKRRKESAEETRRRIVDAIIELHATVGPAKTTISAIAELAGVQRLTVYRHIPDEAALYTACSSRYLQQNPPPDAAVWSHVQDASERTRAALTALYAFYRRTQGVWRNAYRDAADIPALKIVMGGMEQWLAELRDDLLKARRAARRAKARTVLTHALRFSSWDSLQGMADDEMAEAVEKWLTVL